MQVRVEVAGLRASAAALEEALARLERVGIARDLGSVGSAFRGAQVLAASPRACTVWNERLSSLRWQVRSTGAAVDVAAAGYEAVEEVARRALGAAAAP